MKFVKGTKEWNMFGELFKLLKKWTTKKELSKSEKFSLYMDCVEFGETYKEPSEKIILSHTLAYDLLNCILEEKPVFTFEPDTEEKKMYTAFYFLCQTYWEPYVAPQNASEEEKMLEDTFWDDCVREFGEFMSHYFMNGDDATCTLHHRWASSFLMYIDSKSISKKKK